MAAQRAIVIGAGVAGLVTAGLLAARGLDVTVLERAAGPGGKMREVAVAGQRLDAGPTVFTMRWVLDEVFQELGTSLAAHLVLKPAETLARHAWDGGGRLDLFADIDRAADAIGDFAGAAEARGYRAFCARAQHIYQTLEQPFIRSERPTPVSLVRGAGIGGLGDMWRISPFSTLWRALGEHFHDPRLQQLFGRYATYCGSSPFDAPATLMLVAHVEQQGVWLVEGGMHRIAVALAGLAEAHGARLRYGADVREITTESGRVSGVVLASGERIAGDVVVANADPSALAGGLFGPGVRKAVDAVPVRERSLSALTWAMVARPSGFPLVRHNVFFSAGYAQEFTDIAAGRLPGAPTVYVCAQDRGDSDGAAPAGDERLFLIVNAPANGDRRHFSTSEIAACARQTFALLERCGLTLATQAETITTPAGFEALFPATGGALYGRAQQGSMAAFRRAGARTKLPGLFLAGGATHPGPGVPMAAMSGRLAASSVLASISAASRPRSRPAATPGGMSMR